MKVSARHFRNPLIDEGFEEVVAAYRKMRSVIGCRQLRIIDGSVTDRVTGCWIWSRKLDNGYGTIYVKGDLVKAHRESYEAFVGPIHEGLVVDHVCMNKACCNPLHLEPVEPSVNTSRGLSKFAKWFKENHCSLGHELLNEKDADGNLVECRHCRDVRLDIEAVLKQGE